MRRMLAVLAVLVPVLLTGCQPPPPFEGTATTVTPADLGSSWRRGCPVGPSQLRRVRVDYWGYDHKVHRGDLIIRSTEAQHVIGAFRELYAARFPIRRIHPVQTYGSDDDASMAANNTSAFNCRAVTGGTGWSEHSYGTAIDINPVQNPYVTRSGTVLPPSGRPYVARNASVTGTITRSGIVRAAFARIGWEWGGDWTNPKDYQHLSLNNR